MPGFDGTGPSGQGPMTGQGHGFCVLKNPEKKPHQLQGLAGLQGIPVGQISENVQKPEERAIDVPFAYARAYTWLEPLTGGAFGRYVVSLGPGHMNPVVRRIGYCRPFEKPFRLYSAVLHGYCAPRIAPYAGWFSPWLWRGFGFGRGFGRGRGWGRGKFGYR